MPKNTHLFIAFKIIKNFGMAFANICVKVEVDYYDQSLK